MPTSTSSPVLEMPTLAQGATVSLNSQTCHRRILYADDELALRKAMEWMLRKAGFEVRTAADGAEAWEAMQHEHFDLLITDNIMPHLSGVELIERMHQTHVCDRAILVSAEPGAMDWTELDAIAGEAILPKPFSREELLSAVFSMLEHQTPASRARTSWTAPQLPATPHQERRTQPARHWGINE